MEADSGRFFDDCAARPHALADFVAQRQAEHAHASEKSRLQERMAAYERGLLVDALEAAGGNRTQAAKALGIGRATLYEKLNKHGIGRD